MMKKVMCLLLVLIFQLSAMAQEYTPELEEEARDGNVEAMFALSNCYIYGDGVEVNEVKGFFWLKKAARQGHGDALAALGDFYTEGYGVEQDFGQAIDCYNKGIDAGSAAAMNGLGDCYYYGWGIDQDYEQAAGWFNQAAEHGDIDGMNNIGLCFENGEGVQQDYESAYYWYDKAINNGSGDAMAYIGNWYYMGIFLEQDYDKAVQWFIAAIDNYSQLGIDGLSQCYANGYGVSKDRQIAELLAQASATVEEGDFDEGFRMAQQAYGGSSNQNSSGINYIANNSGNEGHSGFSGVADRSGFSGVADNTSGAGNVLSDRTADNLPERPRETTYDRAPALTPAPARKREPERTPEPEPDHTPVSTSPVEEESGLGSSDIDQNIPQLGHQNENTFAVIIANENYQTESKVEFALNDGKTFKKYCQNVLGMPESNIHMVADATLNNIRGQVDWLHKVAEAYKGKATLIFYYAGHGVPDVKSKDAYLLPVDGYASSLITGFRLDDLYSTLAECPSRSTLVFLDACFSGSQRDGNQMKSARAVGIRAKKGTPKGNMVVFSAAQGNETAYPYEEHQHGMFTYFLLKKLKETKGTVTLGDLSSYVIDNVKRKSVVMHNQGQTPSVNASSALEGSWKNISLIR